MLVVLITVLAPISGAHLNPVVSLVVRAAPRTPLPRRRALRRGAESPAALPVLLPRTRCSTCRSSRSPSTSGPGTGQWLAEAVAGVRTRCRHPRRTARQAGRGHPLARRPLHHRGLLVHGIDIVRQSRGDARAGADRYLRRHPPRRRSRVRSRAGRRSAGCDGGNRLASGLGATRGGSLDRQRRQHHQPNDNHQRPRRDRERRPAVADPGFEQDDERRRQVAVGDDAGRGQVQRGELDEEEADRGGPDREKDDDQPDERRAPRSSRSRPPRPRRRARSTPRSRSSSRNSGPAAARRG